MFPKRVKADGRSFSRACAFAGRCRASEGHGLNADSAASLGTAGAVCLRTSDRQRACGCLSREPSERGTRLVQANRRPTGFKPPPYAPAGDLFIILTAGAVSPVQTSGAHPYLLADGSIRTKRKPACDSRLLLHACGARCSSSMFRLRCRKAEGPIAWSLAGRRPPPHAARAAGFRPRWRGRRLRCSPLSEGAR